MPPWLEWEATVLQKQYDAMLQGLWQPSPRQFYTANVSMRRCDAFRAGMFDHRYRRAEDIELAYRLQRTGVTFQFLPEAVVYHEPNRTFNAWRRIAAQYGHYDVVMASAKYRDYMLKIVLGEVAGRPRLLRMAARVLVGRERLLNVFVKALGFVATQSTRLGLKNASSLAFSAIFNLEYWNGVARSLGGRSQFWAVVQASVLPERGRTASSRSWFGPPSP
jgi:GT2 family glycosyltransferase